MDIYKASDPARHGRTKHSGILPMFVWSAGLAQRLFLLFQLPSIHLSIHTDLLSRERAKAWYDFLVHYKVLHSSYANPNRDDRLERGAIRAGAAVIGVNLGLNQ
jgi:hypothetical protein